MLNSMDSNLSFIQEGKTYNIELGTTFQKQKNAAFHTVRYDFKPASVDLTQQGEVVVGETNDSGETNVSITLPHQQGSKNSNTVYKGSKKPAQKECVLIYDEETGSFTLERITSQIQVKKIRLSGNVTTQPVALPPSAGVKYGKKTNKTSGSKSQKQSATETKKIEIPPDDKNEFAGSPVKPQVNHKPVDEQPPPTKGISLSSSSSSSSSSDSSSSDDDSSSSDESSPKPLSQHGLPESSASLLEYDLVLSDSSDDSD